MYIYKVFRLIILAIIITYFCGCLWFLMSDRGNSDSEKEAENTWVTANSLQDDDNLRKLVVACYFALTTLSTVGYGDFYPMSNLERICAVLVMLCGVAFFSYIMGSFIDIIQNYDMKTGDDKETKLNNWLGLIQRFTSNKPIPKRLLREIEEHFNHYWKHDRLASIKSSDEYMNALPRSIKKAIMTNYLFEDVFWKFRFFFGLDEEKNKDHKFMYEVAFHFMPRKFEPTEIDSIIYAPDDDVPEMYFIMEGIVSIGYTLLTS